MYHHGEIDIVKHFTMFKSNLLIKRAVNIATFKSSFLTRNSFKTVATAGIKLAAWKNNSAQKITSRRFTISNAETNTKSSSFEEPITKPIVGYWYLLTGSLVFGIVVIGGLTRLTESGLSITEWNIIRGMKYPGSPEAWEIEFDKYRKTPEYKLLNHNISLQEFQNIFFMEWAHRMWGRLIGMAFIVPGAYFAYRGYMSKAIQARSLMIAAMIGGQVSLDFQDLFNAKFEILIFAS